MGRREFITLRGGATVWPPAAPGPGMPIAVPDNLLIAADEVIE